MGGAIHSVTDESTYDPLRLGWKLGLGIGLLGLILVFVQLLNLAVHRVEVLSVRSPDGSLTASVFEINGGAATRYAYEVDVARNWPVRWNHEIAYVYGAMRRDCADGVSITWADNDSLLITYKEAISTDVDRSLLLPGRTVRIVTRSGVDDPSVPCGEMKIAPQTRGPK